MLSNTANFNVGQELQTLSEPVHKRSWHGSRFPCECALLPTLIEIVVILRVGNTRPPYQRRLNSFLSSRGQIEQTNSLGSQQPLMTCSRRYIHQLTSQIYRQDSQRLDDIDDEQCVVSASCSSDLFKVRTESGGILNMADRHDSRLSIDQIYKLVQVNPVASFFANANLHSKYISYRSHGYTFEGNSWRKVT